MAQRQDSNFVWNDEHPEVVTVRAIAARKGFTVQMKFSNGSTRELDLRPYLKGPVLGALRDDPALFRTMRVEGGTLVWGNGGDIAPETLYEDCSLVRRSSTGKTKQRNGHSTRRVRIAR